MKRSLPKYLAAGFLVVFLIGMAAGTAVPKAAFSVPEKRYLTEFPPLTLQSLRTGEWGEALETWMADHIPFRTFFVGLDACREYLLGIPGEIRVSDGRLLEAPAEGRDREAVLAAIRRLADSTPVTLALVPSAGWAAELPDYRDDVLISELYAASGVDTVDLRPVFAGQPELFYRTDHHWTSAGAFAAYLTLAEHFSWEPVTEYRIETIPDCFRGSTYSRSALWLTKPESLELWHGSEDITTSAGEGVFVRERLEEADKYTVFLGGNQPLIRLFNPHGQGRMLVLRDSYASCLAPFLAENLAEVVLADLRYYHQPISELGSFDRVLVLYSLGNFLTDSNLVLLR